MKRMGGTVAEHVTKGTFCLIAAMPEGKEYKTALKHHVHVVGRDWLIYSLSCRSK